MDGGKGEEECDDVQSETCWGEKLEEAAMVGEKILEDGDFWSRVFKEWNEVFMHQARRR